MTFSQEQNSLCPNLEVRFALMRMDLDVDIGRRRLVEPASLGASPGFLQQVRRCGGTDKILQAHDDDRGLAAASTSHHGGKPRGLKAVPGRRLNACGLTPTRTFMFIQKRAQRKIFGT